MEFYEAAVADLTLPARGGSYLRDDWGAKRGEWSVFLVRCCSRGRPVLV